MKRFCDDPLLGCSLAEFLRGLSPLQSIPKAPESAVSGKVQLNRISELFTSFVRECLRGEAYLDRFRLELGTFEPYEAFEDAATNKTGYVG